jgi:hypothetical protein
MADEDLPQVERQQIVENTYQLKPADDEKFKATEVRRMMASLLEERLKGKKYDAGQCGQGVRIASRCLWDTETDNHASSTFQNPYLYCVAMVFAVYFEVSAPSTPSPPHEVPPLLTPHAQ